MVVVPPLHAIVPAVAEAVNREGSLIVPVTVAVQPFASVTT